MGRSSIWGTLWRTLAIGRDKRPAVALQPVGLSSRDVKALRPVLDKVGEQLAVRFELRGHGGEIVLLDVDYAGRTPPQLVHTVNEDRPVVLVAGVPGDDDRLLSAAETFERCQQELLRQLKEIAVVRDHSVHWGAAGWTLDGAAPDAAPSVPSSSFISAFDSDFDSRIDGEQLVAEELDEARRDLVERVLIGMHDERCAPVCASYGPGANLRFDFRARIVTIDAPAQQHLRVRRELPLLAANAMPQADAAVRELDETIWDLGMASGNFALLDEPDDWWHQPLLGPAATQIGRYSRMPRHLELARRLVAAPATPSELRRHVRISVGDLRRFLQACLFLGLVHWDAAASR